MRFVGNRSTCCNLVNHPALVWVEPKALAAFLVAIHGVAASAQYRSAR